MKERRYSLVDEVKQGRISRRTFLKRAVAMGFSMSAALAMLEACAPKATPTAPPAPTATPAAKATEAPTPIPEPTKIGGAITATYMSSATYDAAAKELVPAFEEKHGTKVTIAAFPWMTLVKNNTMDLLTGAGLYDVQSGSVNANLWAYYEPLDPYIKRDNWKMPYVPGLEDKVAHMEGQTLGVPYAADSYGMAIRADLFEEAGIDIPTTETWTWDQFDEAIAELHARNSGQGISGFVLAGGAVDQNGPFFWGRYDGYHFAKDAVMKHDPDKAIAAFNRLKGQLAYCPDNVMGLSIDEANAVFLQGKACVLDCWPSFIRAALKDPDQSQVMGKWAFMPYPVPGFSYLSAWDILISKFSKNKDAAWEWIKFYVNPENDKELFFKKYGIGPTMVTTYDDSALLAEHPNDFPATKANLARAKTPVVTDEAEWFLDEVVNEVLNGIIGPEEGAQKVNDGFAGMQGTRPEYELAIAQDLVEK